jgi:hypothetical protein
MKPRSANKSDLFADALRALKIDNLGDPYGKVSQVVSFTSLTDEGDRDLKTP